MKALGTSFRKIFEILHFDNWLQILVNRSFFSKTPITTYVFRGLTAIVDHSRGDQDGVRSCLYPGLYDAFFDVIKSVSIENISVLDCGANTGGFSLALLANGFSIKCLVAVELNPVTCSRLHMNLANNDLGGKFLILNGAVAGESGSLEVNVGRGSVADSIVNSIQHGKKTTLPCWTLNDLISNHFAEISEIDLCKIDIEGSEFDVFERSAFSSLVKCLWIIIEIHDILGKSERMVKERIEELGFERVIPPRSPVENNVFLFRRVA